MRVIESNPTQIMRGEVASKLRRTHATLNCQLKQIPLVSKFGGWVPHDLSLDQEKRLYNSQQLFTTG